MASAALSTAASVAIIRENAPSVRSSEGGPRAKFGRQVPVLSCQISSRRTSSVVFFPGDEQATTVTAGRGGQGGRKGKRRGTSFGKSY